MALENFTTYTLTDAGSTYVVTANKVSGTVSRAVDSRIDKNYGTDYFNGDFTHRFQFKITSGGARRSITYWSMGNSAVSGYNFFAGGTGYILYSYGTTIYIDYIHSGGYSSSDSYDPLSVGVDYYITINRDYNGGINSTGRLTVELRTDSHIGTLVDTLSIDMPPIAIQDYSHLSILRSYNDGDSYYAIAQVENLDINAGAVPVDRIFDSIIGIEFLTNDITLNRFLETNSQSNIISLTNDITLNRFLETNSQSNIISLTNDIECRIFSSGSTRKFNTLIEILSKNNKIQINKVNYFDSTVNINIKDNAQIYLKNLTLKDLLRGRFEKLDDEHRFVIVKRKKK